MTFSFQDPGTHPPSFLCGFAEDTKEKDGFQACQRAGFKDTASLKFMKMMGEVKYHQNLAQESGMTSQLHWETCRRHRREDYLQSSQKSDFWYTALLDFIKMIVDLKYHQGSSQKSGMSSYIPWRICRSHLDGYGLMLISKSFLIQSLSLL